MGLHRDPEREGPRAESGDSWAALTPSGSGVGEMQGHCGAAGWSATRCTVGVTPALRPCLEVTGRSRQAFLEKVLFPTSSLKRSS